MGAWLKNIHGCTEGSGARSESGSENEPKCYKFIVYTNWSNGRGGFRNDGLKHR